jgi:hypothetical protein
MPFQLSHFIQLSVIKDNSKMDDMCKKSINMLLIISHDQSV